VPRKVYSKIFPFLFVVLAWLQINATFLFNFDNY
jgi:hypothetical protein